MSMTPAMQSVSVTVVTPGSSVKVSQLRTVTSFTAALFHSSYL